jgi:hypothetical protein
MTYTPPNAAIFELLSEDMQTGAIDLDTYGDTPPRQQSELTTKDRFEFRKRHADDLERSEAQYNLRSDDTVSTTLQATDEDAAQRAERVQEMANETLSGTRSYEAFRDGVSELKNDKRAVQSIVGSILEGTGFEAKERPTEAGVKQDLYDYGLLFDRFPNADTDAEQRDDMFDAANAFRARLGPEREADLDDQMNLAFKDTPLYAELDRDKQLLDTTGYFEREDAAWARVVAKAADRGVTLDSDYDDYRRKVQAEGQRLGGREGDRFVDEDKWLKRYGDYSDDELEDWREANPEALNIAIKWGYKAGSDDDWDVLEDAGLSRPYPSGRGGPSQPKQPGQPGQ